MKTKVLLGFSLEKVKKKTESSQRPNIQVRGAETPNRPNNSSSRSKRMSYLETEAGGHLECISLRTT
jgi:hypothetical protein